MKTSEPCKVEDCSKPAKRRYMCYGHYERWKTYGNPQGGKQSPRGSAPWERMKWYSWTVSSSGCWEYGGSRDRDGYGKVSIGGGNSIRAHRISYEHHRGPIPDGQIVRHKCDNPPCINPDHLELGTHADNSADRSSRGRSARGVLNGNAKIEESTAREVLKMRGLLAAGVVASRLGVSESNVRSIWSGRSWAWLIKEEA